MFAPTTEQEQSIEMAGLVLAVCLETFGVATNGRRMSACWFSLLIIAGMVHLETERSEKRQLEMKLPYDIGPRGPRYFRLAKLKEKDTVGSLHALIRMFYSLKK